jgi:beta-galactosidase/beta-glucuronidase
MIYRPEHPNPQFQRESWMNLNGPWRFAVDPGKSGTARGMYLADRETEALFDRVIQVPFCPESELSGIGWKDFINAVWYRRSFQLEDGQMGGRVLLHFGAVDHESTIYVNGEEVGRHTGGYSSFSFDITDSVRLGENILTVYAQDDTRDSYRPSGKQSAEYRSYGCFYTRTTGIWQTVWLEFVPGQYVRGIKYYPDLNRQCFDIDCDVAGRGLLVLTAAYQGKVCGRVEKQAENGYNRFTLPLSELHLWEAGHGRLYDILVEFGEDRVCSYAGMRQIGMDGYKFLLNGKPLFQRMVLDQGYYRQGIYTAPDDKDLLRDIQLAKALGFNGARLHEKIFEPRFLYHCDREGYLVWGEHANWGMDVNDSRSFLNFIPEWLEAVERDFNHPSIIGWCPFNETWDDRQRQRYDRTLESVWQITKALDPTRPCIDTSGGYHAGCTDIYDIHDYSQDPAVFEARFGVFPQDVQSMEPFPQHQKYRRGMPLFVSEYGGIKWDTLQENKDAWGYGDAPQTEEEFLERYGKLTAVLLENPSIMGFCYTQLYDVEQETNGLCDYDRKVKFNVDAIRAINTAIAAIEK